MAHLFLYDNLSSEDYQASFTLVTGTLNAQFPFSNIQDPATTKVTRINTDAGVAEFYIDTKSLRTMDIIAIVGSSVDGLGFTTAKAYGSATTNFTGSDEVVLDVSADYNIAFKQFTSASFRYVKIRLTGGSYVDVSNLFIGEAVSLGNNIGISQDSFKVVNATNAKMSSNKYGQKFITKYNNLQKISGAIKYIDSSSKDTLEEIFIEVGTYKPLFFITDPSNVLGTDGKYKYSGLYYFTSDPSFSSINGLLWNTDISFVEAG